MRDQKDREGSSFTLKLSREVLIKLLAGSVLNVRKFRPQRLDVSFSLASRESREDLLFGPSYFLGHEYVTLSTY